MGLGARLRWPVAKRVDLHEVPLLGRSSKDLCAAYEETLPVHAHTLLVTLKGMDADSSACEDLKRENSLVVESFPWFHVRLATGGQHLQHRHTVTLDLVICNLL